MREAGAVIDGRFTLIRHLGSGGSAAVWEAADGARGGEHVALKLLHPEVAWHPRVVERFENEARALGMIDDPGIVRLIAHRIREDEAYIAMELARGRPLNVVIGDRAREGRPFAVAELRALFAGIAKPIAAAHARGVVHRDLKPHNLMIDEASRAVKVLDFGIAKLLEGSAHEATTRGRVVGSTFYMAPEQIRGEPPDARSDVFALGVILFEMATLVRAFVIEPGGAPMRAFDGSPDARANALPNVVERMTKGPRPKPSAVRRELEVLDRVVDRATAIAANDRHADAAELLREVEKAFAPPARSARLAVPIALVGTALVLSAIAVATRSAPPSAVEPTPAPAPSPKPARVTPAPATLEAEPEADPDPAPRSPDPAKRIARAPAREKRVAAAPSSKLDAIRAKLRATKPNDLDAIVALAAELTREADQLADAKKRANVRRLAQSSVLAGDLAGLEEALAELSRAQAAP